MMNTLAAIIPPRNRPTRGTATAEPGDVIALTTNADAFRTAGSPVTPGYDAEQTQYWVYGQTTSGNADWDQATIVSSALAGTVGGQSIEAVSIQLPYSLPAHSLYFLYEVNQVTGQAATYSQPYVINQPQVWWTDQNNSYVGGKVSVFGTNLSYGDSLQPYSDQSWVYLFPSNSDGVFNESSAPIVLPLTAVAPDAINGSGAMDVNPYKVDFSLPASVQGGQYYQVEIYNGHGGICGLSAAVAGSGSGSLIYVAPALSLATVSPLPLSVAYKYWSGTPANCPLYLDTDDTQINPAAVNYAIDWANWYASNPAAANGGGGSLSYFAIQLPVGTINITDAADIIQMEPYVHLIGAGDTGNPLTGTVVEADAGAGGALQGLVELPAYGSPPPAGENMALTDMYLCANGQVNNNEPSWSGGGVIFSTGNLSGLILQRLTVDATTDQPAQPYPSGDTAPDIWINDGAFNVQLLDSTLIGPGFSGDAQHSSFDNCHFIGCGTVGVVIGMQDSTDVSITRCTDTSFANNILNPGGDVERDSNQGLLVATVTGPGLYVGDCSTNDVYNMNYSNGDGEQISVESSYHPYNISVAIYQNTLSGDGAESIEAGLDSVGIIVTTGVNIVVADNDVSNVMRGLQIYNEGYINLFSMYENNSIHHIVVGIYFVTQLSSATNVPWFIGCSFNRNLINGICNFPNYYAVAPSAIYIITYPFDQEANSVPQITMNEFNGNTVTGAAVGLVLTRNDVGSPTSAGLQLGPLIFSNDFFQSDGSSSSEEIVDQSGDTTADPVVKLLDDWWEGYWS